MTGSRSNLRGPRGPSQREISHDQRPPRRLPQTDLSANWPPASPPAALPRQATTTSRPNGSTGASCVDRSNLDLSQTSYGANVALTRHHPGPSQKLRSSECHSAAQLGIQRHGLPPAVRNVAIAYPSLFVTKNHFYDLTYIHVERPIPDFYTRLMINLP